MRNTLSFLLFFCWILSAQEHPPLISFNPEQYSAQNQNWGITQSADQSLYFANNAGLLRFDGSAWDLFSLKDNSVIRSVKAVEDVIYSGSYMDFGYWKKNTFGALEYHSLVEQLDIQLNEEEEFWKIIQLDDLLLFQSLSRIYMVNLVSQTFDHIDTKSSILNMFNVDGVVYFQQSNLGVFKIIDSKVSLISDAPILKNNKLVDICMLENKPLFITSDNGAYYIENNVFVRWKTLDKNIPSDVTIYSSAQLKDKSLVFGTISDGLIHLAPNGNVKYILNFERGLPNNTVLSILEDQQSNLWFGLDLGISYVNLSSSFRVYNDVKGDIGTIYTSIMFEEYLYIGTNQGLYYKKRNNSDQPFTLVGGTEGQVWNLSVIDNHLFCGHNKGTIILKNNQVVNTIDEATGTWEFKPIPNQPDLILQGNFYGLNVLEKKASQWVFKNKLEGFDVSSRFFQFHNGKLYVNHEFKGLFELDVDSSYQKVNSFSQINADIAGQGSNILKIQDRLTYTSSKGMFMYDDENKKFVKQPYLDKAVSNIVDGHTSSTLLDVSGSENAMWCYINNNIMIITPGTLKSTFNTRFIPVKSDFKKVPMGFENLTRITDDEYLIGTAHGYYILNNSLTPNVNSSLISISSASQSAIDEPFQSIPLSGDIDLNYHQNNVMFKFNIPSYDNMSTVRYSHKLEGWTKGWSKWTTQSNHAYKNLPYGTYTFKVKGLVGNMKSYNIASYKFTIKRPWYLSLSALVCYVFITVLLYVFIHNVYRRYYSKQQQALLDQTHKELTLKELENNKRLLDLKNEKLEIDIQSKNRELAVSTMSLIKKNEFLNTVKNQIVSVSSTEDLKRVVKVIDNNINNTDDWKLFEKAFNNADKDFLKLIKDKHPSLTPNDLRLCAYLRLNLSSKEIAPLLNISPRSVEVKRYRLRKKMNLPHEFSLTSYIIDL